MKKHGFARDSIWTSEKDLYESDEDAVTGIFKLTDSEETLKQWNYHFELEYLVTLTANSLVTKLVYIQMHYDYRPVGSRTPTHPPSIAKLSCMPTMLLRM